MAHLFHVASEAFHAGGFRHSCVEDAGPGSDRGLGSAALEERGANLLLSVGLTGQGRHVETCATEDCQEDKQPPGMSLSPQHPCRGPLRTPLPGSSWTLLHLGWWWLLGALYACRWTPGCVPHDCCSPFLFCWFLLNVYKQYVLLPDSCLPLTYCPVCKYYTASSLLERPQDNEKEHYMQDLTSE